VSERRRFAPALPALALLILFVFLGAGARHSQAQNHSAAGPTLRIAAAADLQPVLPAVLSTFEKRTGIHTEASYQSSATLATQIINGAPFDIFLAADLSFPQRVIDAGRAVQSRPIPYAKGTLVLWTRNDSGATSLSLDALRSPAIKSIAIANPEHAPYGRAAQAALEHAGLLSAVHAKLVIAENIAQTAQYAESGNAQVAFVSFTAALTPRLRAEGHYILVPAEDYPPILQGAVLIRGSAGAAAASQFLEFFDSPEIARILSAEGLEPIQQVPAQP
jgi:molybdate transport system substrate-binding protein